MDPTTLKLMAACALGAVWIILYEIKNHNKNRNLKTQRTMADIQGQVTSKLDQAKAWYQSKTIWGVIIAAIGFAMQNLFGVDMDGYILGIHEELYLIPEIIGMVLAAYGRIQAKTQVVVGKVKNTDL